MSNPFVFLDDASRADLLTCGVAVCMLSREAVARGTVGEVVDRLMQLSDDDQIARHLAGHVVLAFDGYEDDPREMYMIPEAVSYFRAITEAWPYWFHFLERHDESLKVALGMLMEKSTAVDGGFTFDHDELRDVSMRLFEAMNGLHERLGIDNPSTIRASDEILAALQR